MPLHISKFDLVAPQIQDLQQCKFSPWYIHGYTKEKIYTVAGPEFGELQGQILICIKALYGLKTSMGRWHEALSKTLRLIGFCPSKADLDLWIRDEGGTGST